MENHFETLALVLLALLGSSWAKSGVFTTPESSAIPCVTAELSKPIHMTRPSVPLIIEIGITLTKQIYTDHGMEPER